MEINKIIEKWSSILNIDSGKTNWLESYTRTTTLTKEEVEEWYKNHSSINNSSINTTSIDSNIPLLPVAIRVSAKTLGGDGQWIKSKKQQLKEDRLNKLRELQGEEPNIILPNDEYVEGLISIKPLSAPSLNLFFIDYKYVNNKY